QFRFFIDGSGTFQNAANLAAIGQAKFEEALLKISNFLQTHTNMNYLCYAGGCALNCMANGMLLKRSNFSNMFVPPAPNDAGTALGCAIYGLVDILEYKPEFKWQSDYLGEQSDISQSIKQIDLGDQLILEQPENLQETVANLLTQGNILALFQGRSEFGPRALGNRSIIADARYSVMTTWINQSIKGREWYRPVAPLVLEEDLSIIFETEFPSPFMQFAVPVKKEYQAIIPAGNHVNNTARLQTVSEKDNPFLYSLLQAFKCKTGVGALLNTSFNGRGETIVETLEEAISCFQNTSIHILIAPPYIIRKKNPPPSPLSLASIYDISYNPQKEGKSKKILVKSIK
nr:carbamoyltransferase [Tatlockia sp.]